MRCECGFMYVPGVDDELHGEHHAEYLQGPLLPALRDLRSFSAIDGHPLFVIDGNTPLRLRRALAKVAHVAQGSMRDYPSGYDGTVDEAEQTMFVLADSSHAICMVLIALASPSWRLSWTGEGLLMLDSRNPITEPHRTVMRVWVAAAHRRKRLATRLLLETARHYGLDCGDLGWELPLTKAGASLLRTLVRGKWIGRGDGFSLRQTLQECGAAETINPASTNDDSD